MSTILAARRTGPSPRARGSLTVVDRPRVNAGSIPAGAGEPSIPRMRRTLARVHPRGRGGADTYAEFKAALAGPSPRARGSLDESGNHLWASGSIPAGAGEPRMRLFGSVVSRVHPRGRGGAARWSAAAHASRGPSPRARGSPADEARARDLAGSIPAGAGEPGGRAGGSRLARVHPRGRGGAACDQRAREARTGPSPRARGSPAEWMDARLLWGSIPAGAGEPELVRPADKPLRVHPRGRGGA